ncbi:MAG TPA: GDYXXLXY domain-containing protein [Aequorivita sp.]|nr:GDYXXLXY domain-containing protein [Aequorivita sp.]
MVNKKTIITVFVIVAIIQLAVPAKMIWDKESILKTGKEFKFETAPVDPSDPFRGKYITLEFKENSYKIQSGSEWQEGEEVYVILNTNSKGFATIKDLSKAKPDEGLDYVKATIQYITGPLLDNVIVSYPFDRFYMEESKAYEAEKAYNETQLDSIKTTYALVNIKKGNAALKDVMIDGVSIIDIVNENQHKNK